MKKLLPVIFSGLAAISFSQVTMAGAYGDKDKASGAGPTDNPNVTRDAQGREHANKGKHNGQVKNKKDKDSDDRYSSRKDEDRQSSGSGSTSAPSSDAKAGANADVGASGSARGDLK